MESQVENMLNNINQSSNLSQEDKDKAKDLVKVIVVKQQEIIKLQNEMLEEQEQKVKEFTDLKQSLIDEFNNLPSGDELYEKDLKEKMIKHQDRLEKYMSYINTHGMKSFTEMLVKAHDGQDYLQNFREFFSKPSCSIENQEMIHKEMAKREFEMTKSLYLDFMPLLQPEFVVKHLMYLDVDIGEDVFATMDKLVDL